MTEKLTVEMNSIVELKSPYDVFMMAALLSIGRRYGDPQMFDWAGEFRDRWLGVNPYEGPEDIEVDPNG